MCFACFRHRRKEEGQSEDDGDRSTLKTALIEVERRKTLIHLLSEKSSNHGENLCVAFSYRMSSCTLKSYILISYCFPDIASKSRNSNIGAHKGRVL